MIMKYTVYAERMTKFPAIRMVWRGQIAEQDMREAFETIEKHLNNSPQPLFIFVDLLDPQFTINRTILEALKVFRHPMLREWLVCGATDSARSIGGMLSMITNRNNIKWFDSQAEVLAYMRGAMQD